MDLSNLEADIKSYKEQIELANALERLKDNADFNKVISKGYLTDHLISLVSQRVEDLTPDNNVSRKIDAVSIFKSYLDSISDNGATAKKSLAESEQTLEQFYEERP